MNLALHLSPDKTAFEFGYRDSNMLFRHYLEHVSMHEAQKCLEIRP